MNIKFLVVLVFLLFVCVSCSKKKESPQQDTTSSTTASLDQGTPFKDCPPEGLGGGNELLNRLKNRDREPASFEQMTIKQLIALHPKAIIDAGEKECASWSKEALEEAMKYESRGVSVEGYLLGAHQSGIESCNCRRDNLRDWHVWIGPEQPHSLDEGKSMRGRGMVVEPTPRWQEHKGWRLRQLSALTREGAKVRISGWLLWDQEHPEELPEHKGDRATRGTLWEVHPVTKIEVFTSGRWIELAGADIIL